MIKNALRDDREEEHPALAEADGRFGELLVDEDAVEDGEGRAEQHHGQSAQSFWHVWCDAGSDRHQRNCQDESQREVNEGCAAQQHR